VMMKRFLLLALFLPSLGLATTVTVNGQVVKFPNGQPMEMKGRVMVPLRGVFEAIDAVVEWDGESHHVVAHRGNEDVELTIGNRTARKNGAEIMMEVAPIVRHGSTLVPLRFLVESLGGSVNYDAATDTVDITAGP
jgi:hypothetical protein